MVLFSQQDSKIISISKEFNFKSTYNANKQRFIINDQGKEVDEKTVRGTVYQWWGKQEFKQISSIEGCPQNSHNRISQAALSQAKQGLDGGQELIQTNGSKNSPLSLVKIRDLINKHAFSLCKCSKSNTSDTEFDIYLVASASTRPSSPKVQLTTLIALPTHRQTSLSKPFQALKTPFHIDVI